MTIADMTFFILILIALSSIWFFHLDSDPGGYKDSIKTADKIWHVVLSAAIFLGGVFILHCSLPHSAVLTLLAGIGFEIVQSHPRGAKLGFFSFLDVLADLVGIVLAWAVYILTARYIHS